MRGGVARSVVVLGLLLGLSGAAQADTRLYAFGDSYVNPGPARSVQDPPWVGLLGVPVANLGHGGDTVARTLAVVTRVQHKVRGVAVVEVGLNDLRRHGTDPVALRAFREDYALVLARLRSARLVVVVPPLPLSRWARSAPLHRGSEAALSAYRDVVVQLGSTTPHVAVADPLPQWDPGRMLLPDAVHPNALGRAVIADAVRRVLDADG